MVYKPKTRKLTFTADRTFGTTTAKAGDTLEVESFWADTLIAEGSATEVEDKKAEKAETEDKPKAKK